PAISHKGPLDWKLLLGWMIEGGMISPKEGERVAQRFAAGASAQHALVRLGGMGLARADTGSPLELEALTEWVAGYLGLPYFRIDPLKVDVGRVAEVMSINYARSEEHTSELQSRENLVCRLL